MKKFLYITLALGLVAGVSSCKHEEDDIFDDTAANRLEYYKQSYANALAADGGKWAMEYFANEEEPGYVLVATFNSDGSVSMSGNYKWTPTAGFDTDLSLWEIIADDGPVLTFNSYNKVFHVFSNPENIIGGPVNEDNNNLDIDETGAGHEGDYEFVVMNLSEDGTTVTLQGKKRLYKAYLRRLDSSVNDQEYLAKVYDNSHNVINTEFGTMLLIERSTNQRFVFTEKTESYMDGQHGYFQAYPQGGDSVMQTVDKNAVVSHDGMRFREEFKIPRADASTEDSIAVFDFKFMPDGSLEGISNPDVYLRAPMLADIMCNSTYEVGARHQWTISEDQLGAAMKQKINEIAAKLTELYKGKRDYNGLGFNASNVAGVPTPSVTLAFGSAVANFYLAFKRVNDDTVTITVTESKDTNANTLLKSVPEIADLIAMFNGTYTLSAENILTPTEITWVGDNGNTFNATLKK